jgi:hypothetical protein
MLYALSNFVRTTGFVSFIRNLKLALHRTAFLTPKDTVK